MVWEALGLTLLLRYHPFVVLLSYLSLTWIDRKIKTDRHQPRLHRGISDQSAKSDHLKQVLGSDSVGHGGGGQLAQCPAKAAFQGPRALL